MRIGIIPNIGKDTDLSITKGILKWLEGKNTEIMLTKNIAERLSIPQLGYEIDTLMKQCEVIIVLGGDGTLLSIARQAAQYKVPLFGINLGHLGFLTETETSEMYAALDKLLLSQYHIENRMMLEASIEKDSIQLEKFTALNDIGITRGPFSRIISYKIYINDKFVDLYSADGIIISSPTGSTAYSLSAGGPIVSPDVKILLITPICPHTLHSRSIVVSNKDTVKVEVCSINTEVMLTVDGQQGYKIKSGDIITIKESQHCTSLVKLSDRNFFEVLRRKMSERWDCKTNY